MCAAEHFHIFVWNVCRVKLNSALKRAENKLTLNVKFIEIVYVAVGPLKWSCVAMRNFSLVRNMKEISPLETFSLEPPFCSRCALNWALLQLQPSATSRCKMDNGGAIFSFHFHFGSNIYIYTDTYVSQSPAHGKAFSGFSLATPRVLFLVSGYRSGFCLHFAVSASLLLIFRMAN